MPCLSCIAQLHDLCDDPEPLDEANYVKCCCYKDDEKTPEVVEAPTSLKDSFIEFLSDDDEKESSRQRSGEMLRDVLSTGRKRAAVAKPIVEGAICEWAGLKYAGGGVEPIIGCVGNVLSKKRGQYARHHGPDKSVLNNSENNVHAICPTCHNRWHALNDKYYGDGTGKSRPAAGETWLPNREYKMHDAKTKASAGEIINNEIWWKTNPLDRVVNNIDEDDNDE